MFEIELSKMDPKKNADSGQVFRWLKTDEGYFFMTKNQAALAVTDGDKAVIYTENEQDELIIKNYLDLDTDYDKVRNSIDKADEYLVKAEEYSRGIRVLRQDPWETAVSYIISQNNNIPRIKNSVAALCKDFGKRRSFEVILKDGRAVKYEWNEFPGAAQLKGADFTKYGLGYRAPYMERFIEYALEGKFEQDYLNKLFSGRSSEVPVYEKAREDLIKIYGIGKKVADCICLYGLHMVYAFPVDTWIKKIQEKHYSGAFPVEKYPDSAGILQQYMFYYERSEVSQK